MLEAMASEYGVEVRSTDSEAFQRRFHTLRNKARAEGDFYFDPIRCRIISPTLIYLIKESIPDENTP